MFDRFIAFIIGFRFIPEVDIPFILFVVAVLIIGKIQFILDDMRQEGAEDEF